MKPDKKSVFEKVLHSAAASPGIKIDREKFLRKELSKYFDSATVEKAIESNPAKAGIHVNELEKIAKANINFERYRATTISAIAGLPGGIAMAATLPVDKAQLFAHIMRVLQKLIYIYGWKELNDNLNIDDFDDDTSNHLTLFMGIMFGVNTVTSKISGFTPLLRGHLEKKLLNKTIGQVLFRGIGKIIPIVGAITSGALTFYIFNFMSKRLQKHLVSLPISSVEYYKNLDDKIDVGFSDVINEDIIGNVAKPHEV